MAGSILFAVNTKAKGKIHRVTIETSRQPRQRQRIQCGWRMKKSTSVVYICPRVKWGDLCQKCFPVVQTGREKQKGDPEKIEQFA